MASLTTTPEPAPRPLKHDREDSGVALDVEQVWKLYWEAADGASPYTVLPPPTISDLPKVSMQASSSTTTLVRSGAVRKVRPKSESESVDVWVDAEEIPTPVSVEASASAPALMQTTVEQEQVPSPVTVSLPEFLPVASIQLPNSIADLEKPPPVPENPIPDSKGQSFKSLIATKARILRNVILRRSILYDESNLLATDPAAIDVLLICICAVSGVRRRRRMVPFDLIPGCPISRGKVKAVVDNLPELSQLLPQTSSATRPNSSHHNASLKTLKNEHVKLLTWILTSSFAVLSSVTPTLNSHLVLPSLLPLGIRAFAVTQQPPNRESQFAHHATTGDTFPVFHGTSPARLPLILSQGLRNMSNTRFQAHGKAMGPGIYLAGDPATSLGYSYTTSAWKGSQFRGSLADRSPPAYDSNGTAAAPLHNWERVGEGDVLCKKILLGCELAGEMRGRGTYVIKEEAKVCVRFVFLVPGGWCGEEYPGSFVNDMETVLTEMKALRVGG